MMERTELEHSVPDPPDRRGLDSLGSRFPLSPSTSLQLRSQASQNGRGGLGVPSRDRNVGAPGQDTPGVSLQPLPGDSLDREPGETFPVLTVRPPQSSPSVRPSPSVPP